MSPKKIIGILSASAGIALIVFAFASLWINNQSQTDASPFGVEVIPAKVNFSAPEVALKDLNGKSGALSDYQGSVVLYNAWAVWCVPCVEEMPILQSYFETHKADGFIVIAIEDGSSNNEIADFIKTYNLSFAVFPDPAYIASDAFRVRALPTSFVIDREGTVRLTWLGAITFENLEKYVTPIIQED